MTLHELIVELKKELNLTPEQEFRITAKIKRLVHVEKASLLFRNFLYSQGKPIFGEGELENTVISRTEPKDPFLNKILEEKYKNHEEWAKLPDEKLVTWDVGSHKFKG